MPSSIKGLYWILLIECILVGFLFIVLSRQPRPRDFAEAWRNFRELAFWKQILLVLLLVCILVLEADRVRHEKRL
jgi:hypothetical protein